VPRPARNAELRCGRVRHMRLYMEKRQQRYRSHYAWERVEPRCYRREMPIGLRFALIRLTIKSARSAPSPALIRSVPDAPNMRTRERNPTLLTVDSTLTGQLGPGEE